VVDEAVMRPRKGRAGRFSSERGQPVWLIVSFGWRAWSDEELSEGRVHEV